MIGFACKYFKVFRQKDEGATAIEYAIVAPILFLMVFGILEFSMIMYAQSVLGNATTMVSRYGTTGQDYADENIGDSASLTDRTDFIKSEIVRQSFGLLNQNDLVIKTEVLGDYSSGASGKESNTCNFGQGGEGVMYQISYQWDITTPLIGNLFDNGSYNIKSNTLILNERFSGVADSNCN